MLDYINIGSVPCNEDCSQVGTEDYHRLSRIECKVFQRQLERTFPLASFKVKTFPHDFGSYSEVVAVYDVDDEASLKFALEAESNTPESWDAEAVTELASFV